MEVPAFTNCLLKNCSINNAIVKFEGTMMHFTRLVYSQKKHGMIRYARGKDVEIQITKPL